MKLVIPDLSQVDIIHHIEQTCFPQAEAASKASLTKRILTYPQGYRLCIKDDQVIGYIGGLKTNQTVIDDKMYEDTSYHDDQGLYQMIFSVCILPDYQGKGYARKMLMNYIEEMKKEDLKGIILTCKDHLRPFYESCGFTWMQISKSTHGQAKWNDMILKWRKKMKLLASDFDGTLIHHQENKSYILKEDKQKIIDFQKAGNLFGVCSGRELRGLLNQSEDVKFDFYILHSGGIILDQNQHVIYEKLIGKEDMKKVIELFDKNVCWTIVAGNKKYAMNPHSRIPPYDLLIKDVDEVKEDRIATFSAHFPHDQEAARKCCELVNKNQTIVKAFQNIEDVDIVLNGCSKGNAIHYIQQYYHLKDEDINVIGDSYNDISMFDACHNSFTFFSSPQEVQVHTKTLVHNIKECIEKIISE